jgi:hypothetical protein
LENFFEGLNVERPRSVDYYGDDFYVWFEGAICLEGFSDRLVDVIDMVNNYLYVFVGGVFAFNDLYLTLALVRAVFNTSPLCVRVYPAARIRFGL